MIEMQKLLPIFEKKTGIKVSSVPIYKNGRIIKMSWAKGYQASQIHEANLKSHELAIQKQLHYLK